MIHFDAAKGCPIFGNDNTRLHPVRPFVKPRTPSPVPEVEPPPRDNSFDKASSIESQRVGHLKPATPSVEPHSPLLVPPPQPSGGVSCIGVTIMMALVGTFIALLVITIHNLGLVSTWNKVTVGLACATLVCCLSSTSILCVIGGIFSIVVGVQWTILYTQIASNCGIYYDDMSGTIFDNTEYCHDVIAVMALSWACMHLYDIANCTRSRIQHTVWCGISLSKRLRIDVIDIG